MERQFIVTAQLADDADPERTRQAIADAIAYEGSTTDFGGLASTAVHGQADELPEGALRVELVDLVPDEGVVVTRPELDRALRDAILGGVGILVNMDGTIVAGRPPLHAVRRLWPDIIASLRETGHAWLQRTDDPASVVLIPTGTIRVELDPPKPPPATAGIDVVSNGQPGAHGPDGWEQDPKPVTGTLDIVQPDPEQLARDEEALAMEYLQNPPEGADLDHMERAWLPGEFHHHPPGRVDHDVLLVPGSVRVQDEGHFARRFVADCVSCEKLLVGRVAVSRHAPEIPQLGVRCPDKGACHHDCAESCHRVRTCEPLSGVFPDDEWPVEITARWG